MVFQDYALWPHLICALRAFTFALRSPRRASLKATHRGDRVWLEHVELGHLAQTLPGPALGRESSSVSPSHRALVGQRRAGSMR